MQLAGVVTISLASTLAAGSVTALNYGWRVMQLPETLIATAIATAAFPTLSEFAARGQIKQLRGTLRTTLLIILALTIPATIGLLIFGQWTVQVLYGTSPEATQIITWAVHGYALGMIGHSMLEVTARTFYAQQDTWTPLYVAVGAMGVAIAASFVLRPTVGRGRSGAGQCHRRHRRSDHPAPHFAPALAHSILRRAIAATSSSGELKKWPISL